MIFSSFRTAAKFTQTAPAEDLNEYIDISLLKLSAMLNQGPGRSERQIVFVLEVLQRALTAKIDQKHDNRKQSEVVEKRLLTNSIFVVRVHEKVYLFEQEIYESMERKNIFKLPRLWVDILEDDGAGAHDGTACENINNYRIKASFTKRKN